MNELNEILWVNTNAQQLYTTSSSNISGSLQCVPNQNEIGVVGVNMHSLQEEMMELKRRIAELTTMVMTHIGEHQLEKHNNNNKSN